MKHLPTLIAGIMLLAGLGSVSAQDKEFIPLETWPYVYEFFCPGDITNFKGEVTHLELLNVCVHDGKIHFVKNNVIMAADPINVSSLSIGDETYMNIRGKMMRQLKAGEHSKVLRSIGINQAERDKVQVGYGESSLASTQSIGSVSLAGSDLPPYTLNKNISEKDKYDGRELPLLEDLYIWVDGLLFRAARNELLNAPELDKDAVKDLIKKYKPRFTDPESLAGFAEGLHGAIITE